MKQTLLQTFQWYSTGDGSFWNRLADNASDIHAIGYTMAWLPPAYKGQAGANDVGYGVYDMYDLGEFNDKGSVQTRYGTIDDYKHAIDALHQNDVKVISDIVFNHRMGADERETVQVQKVDSGNRQQRNGDAYQTQVWSKYTFPDRNNKYSSFQWNASCFTGTDYDANSGSKDIMLFEGKNWNENVSHEQGNFDYIMGSDVDTNVDYVRKELYDWGKWYQEMTDSDGYRLDAVKSIDSGFFGDWLKMMNETGQNKEPFAVGEYWSGNVQDILPYLDDCQHCMRLFDVPLHYHLHQCSKSNGNYDVRQIFAQTLTDMQPDYSVPFVDNHDTQPGQALESWVMDWFKPHAYASVLLYKAQTPCVFIGDVEGIASANTQEVHDIHKMVWVRSHLLGDNICDLFDDDAQKASWISLSDHPVMVLYTIGGDKEKDIQFEELKGRHMVNIFNPDHVEIMDDNGHGTFHVGAGQCAVFVDQADFLAMKEDLMNRKPADVTIDLHACSAQDQSCLDAALQAVKQEEEIDLHDLSAQ